MRQLLLLFLVVVPLLLLPTLTRARDGERAPANCQDLVDNHVYECQARSSFGTAFGDCFQFVSPGDQSRHFDLLVDGLPGQVQGCACQPTGTFLAPQFNASRTFVCVASGSSGGLGIEFQGTPTVGGLVIDQGKAVNETGDSFVFLCAINPSCSHAGAAAAARGSRNPYRQE